MVLDVLMALASQLLLPVCVAYAWVAGDEPERIVSTAMLAAMVSIESGLGGQAGPAAPLSSPQPLLDGWLCVVLVWAGLYANRGWTLWVGGLQLYVMLGYVLTGLGIIRPGAAPWVVRLLPYLLQLLALSTGTLAHAARRRRFGRYDAWRRAPLR